MFRKINYERVDSDNSIEYHKNDPEYRIIVFSKIRLEYSSNIEEFTKEEELAIEKQLEEMQARI